MAPLYLGTFYTGLDECVHIIKRLVNRYDDPPYNEWVKGVLVKRIMTIRDDGLSGNHISIKLTCTAYSSEESCVCFSKTNLY